LVGLEVQVRAGREPGAPEVADDLAAAHAAAADLIAGEVLVDRHEAHAAVDAVVDDDRVPTAAAPAGRDDDAVSRGHDRGTGVARVVPTGMQSPGVEDRVEALAELRGDPAARARFGQQAARRARPGTRGPARGSGAGGSR